MNNKSHNYHSFLLIFSKLTVIVTIETDYKEAFTLITGSFQIQHLAHPYDYQKTPHFHDVNELLFTLNDDATMLINQDAYPIQSGAIMFIAQGNLHAKFNHTTEPINSYVIHYAPSLLHEISTPSTDLYALYGETNSCIQLNKSMLQKMISLFDKLLSYQSGFGTDLMNISCLIETLLLLAPFLQNSNQNNTYQYFRDDKWLAPILTYIDNHLTEHISLDELAEKFFTSKFTLCHTFKRKTGLTLTTYINMNRIKTACWLLRQGVSVKETAMRSGFSSVAHFIHTFTVYTDTTPGKYAQTLRNGQHIPIPHAICQPSNPDQDSFL
jgi:AraC-like DNA-binding protein/mannose-6-phosphate isomerase-like protein (cupin superfamily)